MMLMMERLMMMMLMTRLIMMMMTRSIISIEAAEFDICNPRPTMSRDPNNFSTSKIPLCSMFVCYELLLPGVLR